MQTFDPSVLRLAAIVASSDDAIIGVALDGTIETWNTAAERIFGYTAAEAVGRTIDLVVAPEARAEEHRLADDVRRGRVVGHLESTALARGGRRVPITLALSPIRTPDGDLIGISRSARDAARQHESGREALRLAAIVDSSDDAIISKSLEGIVRTWNKGAERIFGYTADEIVGRPITVIIPPDRHGEEDDVLARIRSGLNVDHFETIRQRKDGTLVDISLSVSPIRDAAGRIIGASKIARDISSQRRLARELEDANRVKDEFLATLSHELRTPLNAVLGYTRLLRDGHFAEDRRERAIDVIERNANLLSQLVSEVLDVSGIVTGKIQMKLAAGDLKPIIEAAVDTLRPSAASKNIALEWRPLAPALPARIDADRMQQVFWNLISNAVKFTPAGGRVVVTAAVSGTAVEVSVADNGIGLEAGSLPYVFHRFWQAESTGNRLNSGLGLGLALARHFVELHGGTIHAASPGRGQGSTFTVTLPLSGASTAETTAGNAAAPQTRPRSSP